MSKIRHWYIQKPIHHNVPLRLNGAEFCEFKPTVSEKNCEWIKVLSEDDLKINKFITRLETLEVSCKVEILQNKVALLERKLELATTQRNMFILEKTWPTSTMIGVLDQLDKELEELK